jgi:Fe-S cluster assembly protein SufD
MSAAENTFLSRFDGLKERLPGDESIREAAATAFRTQGFPGRQVEAWKYTSLLPLAEIAFHEPLLPVGGESDLPARLPGIDVPRLVFVDGRFRADFSTALPENVQMSGFAHSPLFGRRVSPASEPLAALNTMLAEDGAVITVPDGVDAGTILLASLATDRHAQPVAFHPRHRIRVGRGAALTLIEVNIGEGTYLHNPVMEISIADDAKMHHIRLQDEALSAFHLATFYVDVASRATYDGFSLVVGARLSRTEIHARLGGPGGAVHLNGAQLLRGNQHADFTSVIAHDAPKCASRQTVKNVLAGHARGVFQGRIEVARAAQKTDGYQMNQALLLSPTAEMDCKPELRIYADDVKCSHGATMGQLDLDQLFYLRSRGVPEAEARAMLVRAFLAEALDPISNEDARAILEATVEQWWATAP